MSQLYHLYPNHAMKRFGQLVSFLLLLGSTISTSLGQQVLMQGWYWDYPKTPEGASWADTLRLQAADLKKNGITHLWFPPHTVGREGPASSGYDPKDLFGRQTTGLGSWSALNAMVAECRKQGITPVADMIYNHRTGGRAEVNPAVKNYITSLYNASMNPYPSNLDRLRIILPLGGTSGNGAGDYYFKISSKTGDARFDAKPYKILLWTNKTGSKINTTVGEIEPNGGGDCGQPFQAVALNQLVTAQVETKGTCGTDEFKLTLRPGDMNLIDTLFITLANPPRNFSDHRIYGLWNGSVKKDIVDQVLYQTYTNFMGLPSGRGEMNYEFFKPSTSNPLGGGLLGDQDGILFYYDYDQNNLATRDSLMAWTQWTWDILGIRGLRIDAIKHFPTSFTSYLINTLVSSGRTPTMVVGEWWGDVAGQKAWLADVISKLTPAAAAVVKPKLFDFAIRENLRKACDESTFDVRNIFQGSAHDTPGSSIDGYNLVTFLNNHDMRDSIGDRSLVHHDPILGYAYLLTNNQIGVPSLFYPDYYGYPSARGGKYNYHPKGLKPLKTEITQLLSAHKQYILNSPSVDYLNRFGTPYSNKFLSGRSDKALIYQLQGSASNGNREVLVAINYGSDTLKVDHQINTRGGTIASGTKFSDALGYSAFPYAVVSTSGQVYLQLPPRSYSLWVQGTLPKTRVNTDLSETSCSEGQRICFQVAPNPVHGTVHVQLTSSLAQSVQIRLIGSNGQEYKRFSQVVHKGKNTLSFDVAAFSTGVYQLSIEDGVQRAIAKLYIN